MACSLLVFLYNLKAEASRLQGGLNYYKALLNKSFSNQKLAELINNKQWPSY